MQTRERDKTGFLTSEASDVRQVLTVGGREVWKNGSLELVESGSNFHEILPKMLLLSLKYK
jgi:hypothetical protein